MNPDPDIDLMHNVDEAEKHRDRYNPLRGLTISRAVSLLEQGEFGQYAFLQNLYRMVEKRFATLRALKQLRHASLTELGYNIKVRDRLPAGMSAKRADKQLELLHGMYEDLDGLYGALEFLDLAEFRGYSFIEVIHENGRPTRLQPIPQWHFARHPEDWQWRYDPEARNDTSGAAFLRDPDYWMLHREVDDPINEIAVLRFIRQNMADKDWDYYVETHGLPSIFIILPENTPKELIKEYMIQSEKVAGDTRGALPPGTKVETIAEGQKGNGPFSEHIKHQDEVVVLAGTSGKLTMLNDATGLGSGQSQAHQDVFNALARATARKINAIFNTQLDKPFLKREFPNDPVVAYFEWECEDPEDLDSMADRATKIYAMGFDLDEKEMSEKFGLKLTRRAQTPEMPGTRRVDPLRNRVDVEAPVSVAGDPLSLEEQALVGVGQAIRDEMVPELTAELRRIDAAPESEKLELLRQFKGKLPGYIKQGKIDRVLYESLAADFFNGLEAKPEENGQ